MARIYEAREIQRDGQKTGRFHMTVASDEEGWVYPIGPCATACEGHPTKEEAIRHYMEGRLKSDLRVDGYDAEQQHKCLECGRWTQRFASLRGEFERQFFLCDTHLTVDVVQKHYIAGDRL